MRCVRSITFYLAMNPFHRGREIVRQRRLEIEENRRRFSEFLRIRLLVPFPPSMGKTYAFSSDGQAVATFSRAARRIELRTPNYGEQTCKWQRRTTLIDVATGATVLSVSGSHIDRKARSTMVLPDGQVLTFPVQGSNETNAVMQARDQSGRTLLHFRIITLDQDPFRHFSQTRAFEVGISPGEPITLQLLWIISVSVNYLLDHFKSSPPQTW
jgi:hypothetical protein